MMMTCFFVVVAALHHVIGNETTYCIVSGESRERQSTPAQNNEP